MEWSCILSSPNDVPSTAIAGKTAISFRRNYRYFFAIMRFFSMHENILNLFFLKKKQSKSQCRAPTLALYER